MIKTIPFIEYVLPHGRARPLEIPASSEVSGMALRIIGAIACLFMALMLLALGRDSERDLTAPTWILYLGSVVWFGWFLAFIIKNDLNM